MTPRRRLSLVNAWVQRDGSTSAHRMIFTMPHACHVSLTDAAATVENCWLLAAQKQELESRLFCANGNAAAA